MVNDIGSKHRLQIGTSFIDVEHDPAVISTPDWNELSMVDDIDIVVTSLICCRRDSLDPAPERFLDENYIKVPVRLQEVQYIFSGMLDVTAC